jgi:hypothetical protein
MHPDTTQTHSLDALARGTHVWQPTAQEASFDQKCLQSSELTMQAVA